MSKPVLSFALGLILPLCACSHHKTLTKDDLRSELTSAKSLAGESEMFLDYARQHRATKHFAEAHFEYLAQQVERSRKELLQSSPAPGEEEAAHNVRAQFDALATELHSLRGRLDDEAALAISKQHMERILQAINDANSSI